PAVAEPEPRIDLDPLVRLELGPGQRLHEPARRVLTHRPFPGATVLATELDSLERAGHGTITPNAAGDSSSRDRCRDSCRGSSGDSSRGSSTNRSRYPHLPTRTRCAAAVAAAAAAAAAVAVAAAAVAARSSGGSCPRMERAGPGRTRDLRNRFHLRSR